jgi:hypothetical protein
MQQTQQKAALLQEVRKARHSLLLANCRAAASEQFLWQAPGHQCSSTCTFQSTGNVIICASSHNWHYCTNTTCQYLIRQRECQVCPLSGFTYDLELEFDCYSGHRSMDTMEAHSDDEQAQKPDADDYGELMTDGMHDQQPQQQKPSIKRKQKKTHAAAETDAIRSEEDMTGNCVAMTHDAQFFYDQTQFSDPTAIATAAAAAEPSIPTASTRRAARIDMAHHDQRLATFLSMARCLFKNYLLTHESLCSVIAANAERLWILLQSGETVTRGRSPYQVEYHFLVVVYNMCHGYNCMRREVVPVNQWVRAHVPQVRDLKRLKGLGKHEIKVKNWTQSSKLFKLCMAEYVRKADAHALQQLAWVF